MIEDIALTIPLRRDSGGALRIAGSRITLDTVLADFTQGVTPEEIVRHYPNLDLADVYAVISYYLRQGEQVETYLQQRRREAEAIRRDVESRFDSAGLRDRLLARRATPAS